MPFIHDIPHLTPALQLFMQDLPISSSIFMWLLLESELDVDLHDVGKHICRSWLISADRTVTVRPGLCCDTEKVAAVAARLKDHILEAGTLS